MIPFEWAGAAVAGTVFLGGVGVLIWKEREKERIIRAFREAAEFLNLSHQNQEPSNGRHVYFEGHFSGHTALGGFKPAQVKYDHQYYFLRLEGKKLAGIGMTIESRFSLVPPSGERKGKFVETGSWGFDWVFDVWAPSESHALAVFDRETRALAIRVLRNGGRLAPYGCEWRFEGVPDGEVLVDRLRLMSDLVDRLVVEEKDIPRRLARNAAEEEKAKVRHMNLSALQREFTSAPETLQASREGLKDADPRVRLRAASFLGREALDVVLGIGSHAGPDLLPSVIETLAHIGGAEFEPQFAAWLQQKEDDVQVAAAKALGEAGTVKAVEALMKCVEDSTLLEGPVKRECRAAVAKIQARLGNVERGTLSLAQPAPQDGALSLGGSGGEVSLPPRNSSPEGTEG